MSNDNRLAIAGLPDARCPAQEYLPQLLAAATHSGLLPTEKADNIRTGIMVLLQTHIGVYLKGESSSLPAETAQSLLQGVLYTLGYALKADGGGDPLQAVELLRREPLAQLFLRGRALLAASTRTNRRLWLAAKAAHIKTPNEPYNITLFRGLPVFFTAYDPAYFPHETPADIDYPLCQPVWQYDGTEFIVSYLQTLLLESRFLRRFNSAVIHKVMQRAQPTYATLPLNLFEPVLLCALGCLATGAPTEKLNPAPDALDNLRFTQAGSPGQMLHPLAQLLLEAAGIEDPLLKQYIFTSVQNTLPRFEAALRTNRLAAFFYAG